MRPVTPLPVRFQKFFVRGSDSECWEWNGQKSGSGYGMIRSGGKGSQNLLAHRLSWQLANGRAVPDGLVVMHSCDNKRCVNPSHLRIGTYKDNVQDMLGKNRQSKGPGFVGESHPRAKLSEEDVRTIRSSNETQVALGMRYGVTQTLISMIKLRKCWSHI